MSSWVWTQQKTSVRALRGALLSAMAFFSFAALAQFTDTKEPSERGISEVFFSEYIEGSSNNKAVEIYNASNGTIDFDAGSWEIDIYANGSATPTGTIALTGTLASDAAFVLANASANAAILNEADQTSGSLNYNGNDAVVLRSGATVVDSIGQIGVDQVWGSGDTTTQNDTIRRNANICMGDINPNDAYDTTEWTGFAQDTFDGVGAHTSDCFGTTVDAVINEFVFNHDGTDTNEFIEILGPPNTDMTSYMLYIVEGDTGSTQGQIRYAEALTMTDANGYWTTGYLSNAFQNATQTILLVEEPGGPTATNTDLDTNDDGVFDVTPWNSIVDDVAVTDEDAGDLTYSTTTLLPSFDGSTFTVGGASRIPNGTDTDAPGDWVRNDFDGAGLDGFMVTPDAGEAINTLGLENEVATDPGPTGGETLLLSEIVVTPTAGEFIEIHNPTMDPIDLTDVYLTDATFANGDTYYYNIVTGANAGGGGFGDFHARFPSGSSIAAGAYMTVALTGSTDFNATYGFDPDFELFEDDGAPDAVPDMLEATAGSINNQGGLTNGGEIVILYQWDGSSDLVQDLDYIVWGDKAEAVDKTGISIDGPDGDMTPSFYLDDTAIASQDVVAADGHGTGESWQRADLTEGTEADSDGNGATGHDETSENASVTWVTRAPSPGTGLPPQPAVQLLLTEVVVTPTAGEFVEIHNPTLQDVDLSNYYLTDATFANGSVFYYNIVTGVDAGGGGFGDFHARFPDGSILPAGGFITVSLPGAVDFNTTYGFDPDFELFDTNGAVTDMVEAFAGSINGQGGLTNSGEAVFLYFWDGTSDLVTDVDQLVWGDKAEAVDKTGITIDGPDPDSNTSAYLDDTIIANQDVVAGGGHSSGEAFVRVDVLEGTELKDNGNGVNDDDETSENTSVTWQVAAPSPGEGSFLGLVINEVHADPATENNCTGMSLPALCGDANGDGVTDSSDDEFIEFLNLSGAPLDISGLVLSDGASERHVFPGGSILDDQCGLVLFGGGSISGTFGGMSTQLASSGALGLNNGGDSITIVNADGIVVARFDYGGEGGDNQSLVRDPDGTGAFVQHTVATGSAGDNNSPGVQIDGSNFAGCTIAPPVIVQIYEIQGSGEASPNVNSVVTTEGIVTAVIDGGFFIQTATANSDNDANTSDGIQVVSATSVAVGDAVTVTGTVEEFFGLTRLNSVSSVTIDSNGNAVPAAVLFDATTPSTMAMTPHDLERFEGMLVRAENAMASGGTDRFGDTGVTLTGNRAIRETGIEFPGLNGLPVWDGNPEMFEINADGAGLANTPIFGGQMIDVAQGPLTYSFGDYQVLPTTLTLGATPNLPAMVRTRNAGEFTIATQNVLRLYDTVDDPATDDEVFTQQQLDDKLAKLALQIVEVMDVPDVLCLQEVENLTVLNLLAAAVDAELANRGRGASTYAGYLESGNDPGGINVGFLVRDTVTVDSVTQINPNGTFTFEGNERTLHDRPPLLLRGSYSNSGATLDFAAIGVHNRSLGSIDTSDFAREKRLAQATDIANEVQALQTNEPELKFAVLGDFNGFEFTDGYVDVLGVITGDLDPAGALLPGTDVVDPNLINQTETVAAGERYSFNNDGNLQALDHILTNAAFADNLRGLEYARGNADAPNSFADDNSTALRAADHDGLVLYVMSDNDGDGVPNDVDNCPDISNPGQGDVDGDGIGDLCDPVDDSLTPEVTVNVNGIGFVEGEVFDGTGIQSLVLSGTPALTGEGGAINLQLTILSGTPGDTNWNFRIDLIDPAQAGFGYLIATDMLGNISSTEINIPADQAAQIPTLGEWGLIAFIISLAMASMVMMRRQRTLQN